MKHKFSKEGKVTPEVKREIEKASRSKKFVKLRKKLGCKCHE